MKRMSVKKMREMMESLPRGTYWDVSYMTERPAWFCSAYYEPYAIAKGIHGTIGMVWVRSGWIESELQQTLPHYVFCLTPNFVFI